MYRVLKLNESKKLEESTDIEKYWDATLIDEKLFKQLLKFNFGTDSKGNNYIVLNDNNEIGRFRADSDEEAKKKFREEFLKESTSTESASDRYQVREFDGPGAKFGVYDTKEKKFIQKGSKKVMTAACEDLNNKSKKLTEAEDDEEEDLEDTQDNIEASEDLEDIVDSEEDQEENPVEEESILDNQLDELRDILVDLDLNLYRIASKEDPKDVIYIIGKVSDDTNDTLMLIDTKPEEMNEPEIEEPIIDNIETDEEIKEDEDAEKIEVKDEEKLETPEERFDFVVLPKSFDEINKLNPRYGEDLTPDHEAIVDYLMNCLIEVNPEAAEKLADDKNDESNQDLPTVPEDGIDVGIDIDREEDLDNED